MALEGKIHSQVFRRAEIPFRQYAPILAGSQNLSWGSLERDNTGLFPGHPADAAAHNSTIIQANQQ
jgi:hypothetical protein